MVLGGKEGKKNYIRGESTERKSKLTNRGVIEKISSVVRNGTHNPTF